MDRTRPDAPAPWCELGGVLDAAPDDDDPAAVLSLVRGVTALWQDDPVTARAELAAAHARAVTTASAFVGDVALTYLCDAECRLGWWDDAITHGRAAVARVDASMRPWCLALAHSHLAVLHAARGDLVVATTHLDEALALACTTSVGVWVEAATALCGLVAVRTDEARAAVARLERHPERDLLTMSVVPWQVVAVEVHLAAGDTAAAAEVVAGVRVEVVRHRRPIGAFVVERLAGRVYAASGEDDAAEVAYEHAQRMAEGSPARFDVAMVHLDRGAHLRRCGHRRAAAAHLRHAADQFDAMGAAPCRVRAERELAACGLEPVRRSAATGRELTSQERAVAEMVGQGLRNKEVARALFVSPRTVEYHLGNLFRKLGVTNRVQLAQVWGGAGTGTGGPES